MSAIETGVRRVRAEELLLAMEQLSAPLDYFTDPYRLDGEGLFSWRQMGVPREQLMEYETMAGRWIGGYRVMASQVGRQPQLLRQALGLTKLSSFEEAMEAGERFVAEFDLGPVPSLRLAEVMEEQLGILVLMVDAYEGISGAACRLPDLDTVLIARGEVRGRRNFDLAHELFHILTWDAMPPGAHGGRGRLRRQPSRAVGQQFCGSGVDAKGLAGIARGLGIAGYGSALRTSKRNGGGSACDLICVAVATRGAWKTD